MRLITGDETGLIKIVDMKQRNYITYMPSIGRQSRQVGAIGMCWADPNHEYFILMRKQGQIEKWMCDNNHGIVYSGNYSTNFSDPLGVFSDKEDMNKVICYNSSGTVQLLSTKSTNISLISEFSTSAPINAAMNCINGLAVGGKENDLQLYDLTTQTIAWRAKNVPYDNLSLRVPIWITAIAFPNAESNVSGCEILTGTAYKQVRLYDTRAKRQPVMSMETGSEFRVTALLPGVTDHTVYISDTSGGLFLWDYRKQRRLHTLKGCTGSIRQLEASTSGKFIASVGLERFARIYDTKTHTCSFTAYLKNKLNCCLIKDEDDYSSSAGKSNKHNDNDSDDSDGEGEGDDGSEDVVEDFIDSDAEIESDDEGDEGEGGDNNNDNDNNTETIGIIDDSDDDEDDMGILNDNMDTTDNNNNDDRLRDMDSNFLPLDVCMDNNDDDNNNDGDDSNSDEMADDHHDKNRSKTTRKSSSSSTEKEAAKNKSPKKRKPKAGAETKAKAKKSKKKKN